MAHVFPTCFMAMLMTDFLFCINILYCHSKPITLTTKTQMDIDDFSS